MNNIVIRIKKFLSNKNTVTVIGVIAAVIVLFVGYNWRVNSAINPITVPYAIQTITPGTEITQDMIGTMEVPPSMLKGGVIREVSQVVNKYASSDSIIPEGSVFYSRLVVPKDQLEAAIIYDYPKGYVLYNLPVDTENTYGNSIFPGNYIDIYLKAINRADANGNVTQDKIMVGRMIENVKVIAVKDSSGNDVFSNLDEKKDPALIIFAVPEDINILLRKASYLRTYETTIIPVPTNESLQDKPGEVKISSNDLKNFINNVTAMTDADLAGTS